MKYVKSNKLDISDRMTLQGCLHAKYNVSQICKTLKVNKTTIYRELKRNSRLVEATYKECKIRDKIVICNRCYKRNGCNKDKIYYDYKYAQKLTDNRRSSSRAKPRIKKEEIKEIDDIVLHGVNLGQSLHHIYVSNPRLKYICCEKTIRRLIYRGNLKVKSHQLRRYLVQKRVYKKEYSYKNVKDIRVLIGRTFKDYKSKVKYNKDKNIVQYDSVIGKRSDKKAILTITFPKFNFQFGILINKNDPTLVVKKIKNIFIRIGINKVKEIFPINLSDNGFEFSNFHAIEYDENGEKIANTYYTTPYRSTDKAECERNHEFIRYCIPKSKSIDKLTQEDLNNMFSNINSYVRKSLNDTTPYKLTKEKFGKEFLDLIGISKIERKKVKLLRIV